MSGPDPRTDPVIRTTTALGLPPDATAADMTAALLRRLPAEGFAPPEDWAAGLNAASGTTFPVTTASAEDQAARLRDEVAAFAGAYWELPPPDRRTWWEALMARNAGRRLKSLEAGLDVEVKPQPDPLADELAQLIRELFVLPHRERCVGWARWLADKKVTPRERALAVARLQADDPATVALEPDLLVWFPQRMEPADTSGRHRTGRRAARVLFTPVPPLTLAKLKRRQNIRREFFIALLVIGCLAYAVIVIEFRPQQPAPKKSPSPGPYQPKPGLPRGWWSE